MLSHSMNYFAEFADCLATLTAIMSANILPTAALNQDLQPKPLLSAQLLSLAFPIRTNRALLLCKSQCGIQALKSNAKHNNACGMREDSRLCAARRGAQTLSAMWQVMCSALG